MSKSESAKSVCVKCSWRGKSSQLLEALNPFDDGDIIRGCPDCKRVDCFRAACDEEGCWDFSLCGTPTPNGYRITCRKHKPEKDKT